MSILKTDKLKSNQFIYLLLLLTSLVFSYLVVVPYHFPSLGVSISAITLSTIIFVLKKERSDHSLFIYLLTLAFSFFLVLRANGFLTFLNTITAIYLGAALIVDKKDKGFIEAILSPLNTIFKSLFVNNVYYYKKPVHLKNKKAKKRHNLVLSILITIILLAIIIPILSYSNPIFNRLIENTLGKINLENIIKFIFGENLPLFILRVLLFAILAFNLPRFVSLSNDKEKNNFLFNIPRTKLDLFIPKVAVSIVLFVFFVTQAKLYLSTEDALMELGYTHSQYAREVFAHLSIVSLIIFFLLYSDTTKSKLARKITYVLIIEGLFLNICAFKSVYDYSLNWGFTYKRLYGFSVVAWIVGAYTIYSAKLIKKLNKEFLVRNLVYLTSIILIAINLINFDYIIFHYAKSATHAGIDHSYLSKLSPDSHSFNNHLRTLMSEISEERTQDYEKTSSAFRIIRKIEYLRKKYDKLDLRTFNLSEFLAYKNTSDLDLENYKKSIDSRTPPETLPPNPPLPPEPPLIVD